MTQGTVRRDLLVVAGLPVLFLGLVASWLLALPDGPDAVAVPAGVALGASVVVLGLGLSPLVGATPSSTMIGGLAGVWVMALLVSAWVRTAGRVDVAVLDVTAGDFVDVLADGAPEVAALVAASGVLAWAVIELLTSLAPPVLLVGAMGTVGVLAMAISGHARSDSLGPVLIGAHALAAAWWCGTLSALALSVRGRSGWARSLPAFARYAPWAVVVIAVSGVIAGVRELDDPAALFTTGYGRILVAKTVFLVALLAIANWHRRRWVPAAERHRVDESTSIRRAATEVAVMAVVLGLAAGLSVTAPGAPAG